MPIKRCPAENNVAKEDFLKMFHYFNPKRK
jgi:hypothetical protein